nr:hypothetical protein [Tanacetum cinerariifolium]
MFGTKTQKITPIVHVVVPIGLIGPLTDFPSNWTLTAEEFSSLHTTYVTTTQNHVVDNLEEKPVRIIPGPAGIVQVAKLRGSWVSAVDFVNVNGVGIMNGCLGDIENYLKNEKLEQVVAIIKSCTLNSFGDLIVTLKDLSSTIPVVSPKPSMHYFNITMRNVVKVFHKDTVLGNGSGSGIILTGFSSKLSTTWFWVVVTYVAVAGTENRVNVQLEGKSVKGPINPIGTTTWTIGEIGRSSRIDDEVVQDQRQRDDNDLQDERQDQPKEEEVKPIRRKSARIKKSFGPDLFLSW